MKCRKKVHPIEAHVWFPTRPHPDQFVYGGEIAVRVLNTPRRRVLSDGDVILPTGLAGVYEVLTPAQFAAGYEWVD